jgi:D-lactate dehydrogenase
MFPSATGDFFECSGTEAQKALLHRFAVAGAAIRYRAIHRKEVGEIISLDIALRRNDREWCERLPQDITPSIAKALYYGHFFCHVFHQDYILIPDADVEQIEMRMLQLLDQRGAQYPAEHNVGHHYCASPHVVNHYKALDPCNQLNPGIGNTSRKRHWL